jgi:hypothetical protein
VNQNGDWEVRRDGQVIACGSNATIPDKDMRKQLRLDGYKIYVDRKLYRE